MQHNII